jgi:hypothetical protein
VPVLFPLGNFSTIVVSLFDEIWRSRNHHVWINFDTKFLKEVMLRKDDWLTVHRSTTLVDFQLHAQNSYLFTYNIFIK